MSTTTTSKIIAASLLLLSGFLSSTSAQAIDHIEADHTPNDFVTKWRVPAGTDVERTLTFPGVGSYTIDWGDATPIETANDAISHTYATTTARTYTVTTANTITCFNLNNGADKEKLMAVTQWGTASWSSMQNAFYDASNMTMGASDAPNLTNVSNMSNMFRQATAFNANIAS